MALYCNSNINETRTLVTGAGWFYRIVINDTGSIGSVIEIYDNTSATGTLIAKIDPTTDSVRIYDTEITVGLTYKTIGGPGNFTIIYK